ncbi:nucleoid-associated protein [Flavobacterium sp. SUN052]|uniref:nucleoid-associated protein n=1 Tax=Flavobacterium sp. SUN052 TaxID=3002441 RepID=UPI00237ED0A8|nr:nucleoid-associated protein [Flavobacterium sp. SUN052]MEC4004892.1 nucleoid-associated protein [Flavobacterium sp. SUN052]
MILKNIVLHQIVKELKGKPYLNNSNKLINISSTVNEFVEKLIKNYSSKNPTQGSFKEGEDNYPFQKKVKIYFQDNDFLKFSVDAMEILLKEIDKATTTGGYVVFVHYEDKKTDFLITAMLDKSAQFTVDDKKLDIEKLMTLDIDKLARANRLNVNRWNNNEPQYLSFIKGTREISKYFLDFIGSTDISSSKQNLKILKDTIDQYVRFQNIRGERKERIRENISNYLTKCFNDEKEVEIDSVSSLIDNENPNDFKLYITENEIEVSDKIKIYKKGDYEIFIRNRIKEDGYVLVFDKALINSKITREGNNIIIHDVPEESLDLVFEIGNNEPE